MSRSALAPDPPPIKDAAPELGAALKAAAGAGAEVLDIYRRNAGGSEVKKKDGSPVTEADLASHRILTELLSETGHAILSEEDADRWVLRADRTGSETVWIVDPLDGTSDFIDRTGEFTIMAALVKEKRPVLGVILRPTDNTVFAAQKGRGAFCHGAGGWRRITVTDTSALSECRMVGSRHHLTDQERGFIAGLGVKEFVSIGSSLKVGMISSGEAEAYITTTDKIKEWDTAASHCIITEAGGMMTDVRGRDLTYNNEDVHHRHGVLATNGAVHGRIVSEFALYSDQAAAAEK